MAESVQIVVRTRPFNEAELKQNDELCISMVISLFYLPDAVSKALNLLLDLIFRLPNPSQLRISELEKRIGPLRMITHFGRLTDT